MDNREFRDSLIKEKKKYFIAAVFEAADKLKVKHPIVKIWECPYGNYNPDEIAHCHHAMGMICISERMLERRNFEDLVETATHEVTHLLYPNHDHEFHQTHQSLMETSWRPPSGVGISAFSEADLSKPRPKYKPSKPDIKHCNYYQSSNHKKGKLKKCSYCKKTFCEKHNRPRKAGIIDPSDPNRSREEDFESSHPCIGYGSYLSEKKKIEEEAYAAALEKMFRKNKIQKDFYILEDKNEKIVSGFEPVTSDGDEKEEDIRPTEEDLENLEEELEKDREIFKKKRREKRKMKIKKFFKKFFN